MRRSCFRLSTVSIVFLASVLGGQAQAATGGPDAFGYTYRDQDDLAVYNYVDITATGVIVVDADDAVGDVTLGAPMTIYGVDFTDLRASTNGFLTSAADAGTDLSNTCPLPDANAVDFRIDTVHDDLVTTVYYEYFDEAAALALGYPGETAGISVFQWTGSHFSTPPQPVEVVDLEVILFHDDGTVLSMVATDGETGSGSTTGIQNPDGLDGLTYACNTVDSTVPGVTAVQYSPPPPPVTINEIRIDQDGGDDDEFFELAGPAGTLLNGLTYVVLGDNPTGQIEAVVDLSGAVIPPSGFFVGAEATFTIGTADATYSLAFENNDTVTHMLVRGFVGAVADNVDADGDGVFDNTPWDAVLDTVALVHPASAELPYGPPLACSASATCSEVSGGAVVAPHAFRCGDATGGWNIGLADEIGPPVSDSPGVPNPCVCGDGVILSTEGCDDAGESAACNADCTVAACGDGVLNMTAGEECDDAGESATCNADCTVASCGDGVINAAGGEECDDAGESAACDDDCTAVACGDGNVNVTAGEDCDDAGESVTCDEDCTNAVCGDSTVNSTAGETCDDGGRSAACNDDCTAASCGDGLVNATAGEECDGDGVGGPGETDVCDDDCTDAMCGDGVLNVTAGEACDDGGESDVCNDDCTESVCGDGVTNATAGEECDDANNDDGDGCADDCTVEEAGTTGDTGETGETGGSTGDGGSTGATGDTGDSSTGPGGADSTGGDGGVTLTVGALTTGGDGSTGGDTGGTAGADPLDDGCNCSTGERGQGGRGIAWSFLTLLGLGAMRRRRHSA